MGYMKWHLADVITETIFIKVFIASIFNILTSTPIMLCQSLMPHLKLIGLKQYCDLLVMTTSTREGEQFFIKYVGSLIIFFLKSNISHKSEKVSDYVLSRQSLFRSPMSIILSKYG